MAPPLLLRSLPVLVATSGLSSCAPPNHLLPAALLPPMPATISLRWPATAPWAPVLVLAPVLAPEAVPEQPWAAAGAAGSHKEPWLPPLLLQTL